MMPSTICFTIFLIFLLTICAAKKDQYGYEKSSKEELDLGSDEHSKQSKPKADAENKEKDVDEAKKAVEAAMGAPAEPSGIGAKLADVSAPQAAQPTNKISVACNAGQSFPTASCSGTGWIHYNGKCYKVVEGLMGFTKAYKLCQAEDPKAHLVVIGCEEENRKIGEMIKPALERSRTLHPKLATTLYNTFWIGLQRVKAGNAYASTWVNTVPAVFGHEAAIILRNTPNKYPWGLGQPSGTHLYTDPTGKPELCVHMVDKLGQWNDAQCDTVLTGGICQKPLMP